MHALNQTELLCGGCLRKDLGSWQFIELPADWNYLRSWSLPMACLPIAHWYVFLGDWLWWGYGMRPAHTPSSVKGSISKCVVSLQRQIKEMMRLVCKMLNINLENPFMISPNESCDACDFTLKSCVRKGRSDSHSPHWHPGIPPGPHAGSLQSFCSQEKCFQHPKIKQTKNAILCFFLKMCLSFYNNILPEKK